MKFIPKEQISFFDFSAI